MKIGHVHLKVSNLERSEKFYQDLLGLRSTERLGEQFSFLTFGHAHHDVALQQIERNARQPDRSAVGLFHSAFEVENPEQFAEVISRIEEMNLSYSTVDYGISWAVYVSDPDGNGVEIFLDRRGTSQGRMIWGGESRRLNHASTASA